MVSTNRSGQLSMGVRILDCDHWEMSETIQDIQTDLLAGKEREGTGRRLSKLAAFTVAHFALEEGIMSAAKYPGLIAHSLRHQRMAGEINAFAALYRRGGLPLNNLLANFVHKWHAAHTANEDMSFGFWLNEFD